MRARLHKRFANVEVELHRLQRFAPARLETEDIAPHLLRQPKVLQLARARFQSVGHVRRAVRRAKFRQTDRPPFVELSGDQCVKPCRRMRERLALKSFARIVPRPLTQPARRRITSGVTESVLDKLSGDHEIAPVIAYAAEDDVRVFPLTPLSIGGFVGRDVAGARI